MNALPASYYMELCRSQGIYTQLELDLETPPWVFVNPKYLKQEMVQVSYCSPEGKTYGSRRTTDHPSFEATRDWLEKRGYIRVQKQWSNGDRVLKPFYFNNVYKEVGDRFLCSSAMKHDHTDKYNDGKILEGVKNYKDDSFDW